MSNSSVAAAIPAPLKVEIEYSTYSLDIEKKLMGWLDGCIAKAYNPLEEITEGLRGTQHLPSELSKLRTAMIDVQIVLDETMKSYKKQVRSMSVFQTEQILYSVGELTQVQIQKRDIHAI